MNKCCGDGSCALVEEPIYGELNCLPEMIMWSDIKTLSLLQSANLLNIVLRAKQFCDCFVVAKQFVAKSFVGEQFCYNCLWQNSFVEVIRAKHRD